MYALWWILVQCLPVRIKQCYPQLLQQQGSRKIYQFRIVNSKRGITDDTQQSRISFLATPTAATSSQIHHTTNLLQVLVTVSPFLLCSRFYITLPFSDVLLLKKGSWLVRQPALGIHKDFSLRI